MTTPARHFRPQTDAQQRQIVRRIDAIERSMIPADFDPHSLAAQQFGQLLTPPDSACTFGECRSNPACKERCPNKPRELPPSTATPTACPSPEPMPSAAPVRHSLNRAIGMAQAIELVVFVTCVVIAWGAR